MLNWRIRAGAAMVAAIAGLTRRVDIRSTSVPVGLGRRH
jgi:hypothetical protein